MVEIVDRVEVIVEQDDETCFRRGVSVEAKSRFPGEARGVVVGDFWRSPNRGHAMELAAMTPSTARAVAQALLDVADELDSEILMVAAASRLTRKEPRR